MAHVVDDADGEATLRRLGRQFVEHGLDHRRRELLRAEAVPPADDPHVVATGFRQRGDDVLEQRFADGARLLGAVEHGDRPDRRREGLEQRVDRERTEQTNGQHTDPLAVGGEAGDRLARGAGAGPHQHDDALRIGVTLVVDE